MNFYKSRDIPIGFTVKTVTVRRKADGWYVSLRLEDKTVPEIKKIELSEISSALPFVAILNRNDIILHALENSTFNKKKGHHKSPSINILRKLKSTDLNHSIVRNCAIF